MVRELRPADAGVGAFQKWYKYRESGTRATGVQTTIVRIDKTTHSEAVHFLKVNDASVNENCLE